jgi:maleylacetoacetate isomerase
MILWDYWRSSSAYRVRIALALGRIAHERVHVNLLAGEQRGAAHLARNPQGLVPVLEVDGLRLTQSLAILEYLDETRGLGLLPADAPGRARVRALAQAVAMEIAPVCNLRVARAAAALRDGMEPADWMRPWLAEGLAAVEAMLDGPGAFCHGDGVTLADLCLVPQVYNARRWGVDLSGCPRITAIDAGCGALEAFRAAHPDAVGPPP